MSIEMLRHRRTPGVRHRLCALTAMVIAVLLGTTKAGAQTFIDRFWETDGSVSAIAPAGRLVYIGGSFSYVGPRTPSFVATDPASGVVVPGAPTLKGMITSAIPDGLGGWFVAGNLTELGGQVHAGLAHIRADLSVDPWAPQVWPEVLAREGNVLYVGGSFTSADGRDRGGLAAYDLVSGQLMDWNPSVSAGASTGGEVIALATSGSIVYVGGWFEGVGGEARLGLAAVDATSGAVTSWDPGENGSVVVSIVPRGSQVYVGGWFDRLGGQPRVGLAAIDATTGAATAWDPQMPGGYVQQLLVQNTTLYVAGGFTGIGGESRNNFAAIDLESGLTTAWNPDVDAQVQCMSMTPSGSSLYIGGMFQHVGGQVRYHAAAINVASASPSGWDPRANSTPLVIMPEESRVLVAGQFHSLGGVVRANLAALDTLTGRVTDWNPGSDNTVTQIAVSGTKVYLGGYFSHVGGEDRDRLAALDAVTGHATPWDPHTGTSCVITGIIPVGSAVYVSGTFTSIGGANRMALAAVDSTTGLALPWAPTPDLYGWIWSMAKGGSRLYIGGQFSSIDGQVRPGLASFDLATGALRDWNPGASGRVLALAATSSSVYAGGTFNTAAGQARSNVVAIDATTGTALPWDPAPDGAVTSIQLGASRVYMGGEFNRAGGGYGSLVALDPVTAHADPWIPLYNSGFGKLSVAEQSGQLYVGGTFGTIADHEANGFAAFSIAPDVTPPVVHVLEPRGGENVVIGSPLTIRWSSEDDGQIFDQSVFVSRDGPTGPWYSIGYGNGSRVWTVTGPACANNTYIKVVATDAAGNKGSDVSDAPFTISTVSADTIAPVVHVNVPNGLDELAIGYVKDMTWSATDNVGVTHITLYLSRTGPAGPWETIADDRANNGHFDWQVTGPPCLLTAYFRVDATDAAGNRGIDISDQPFSITTGPVPTFVELLRATPTALGVKIEWRLADPASVRSVELQRAASIVGEWTSVTATPRSDGASTTVLDDQAPAGASLWYRLSGVDRAGASFATTPVEVDALAPVTDFALAAPAPNPTAGRALVSFALPVASSVRLALVDVQGREVALLATGEHPAGRYTASLDASDLRSGLYFVRMQAGHVTLTRRLILVR